MNISTIYFNDLQLESVCGNNYNPITPTLNDVYDINTDNSQITQNPILKYISVGVGGIETIDTNGQISKRAIHNKTDYILYNQIPFRLVLKTSDLDLIEQKKYRFRKEIYINNIEYVGYYLKVLPSKTDRNNLFIIDSDYKLKGLLNDTSILNVTPNKPLSDDYVVVDTRIDIELTELELNHIDDVLNILNIQDKYITEFAICSGVDINDSAYMVQPMFFIHTDYNITTKIINNENITLSIDIGGMDLCRI